METIQEQHPPLTLANCRCRNGSYQYQVRGARPGTTNRRHGVPGGQKPTEKEAKAYAEEWLKQENPWKNYPLKKKTTSKTSIAHEQDVYDRIDPSEEEEEAEAEAITRTEKDSAIVEALTHTEVEANPQELQAKLHNVTKRYDTQNVEIEHLRKMNKYYLVEIQSLKDQLKESRSYVAFLQYEISKTHSD